MPLIQVSVCNYSTNCNMYVCLKNVLHLLEGWNMCKRKFLFTQHCCTGHVLSVICLWFTVMICTNITNTVIFKFSFWNSKSLPILSNTFSRVKGVTVLEGVCDNAFYWYSCHDISETQDQLYVIFQIHITTVIWQGKGREGSNVCCSRDYALSCRAYF